MAPERGEEISVREIRTYLNELASSLDMDTDELFRLIEEKPKIRSFTLSVTLVKRHYDRYFGGEEDWENVIVHGLGAKPEFYQVILKGNAWWYESRPPDEKHLYICVDSTVGGFWGVEADIKLYRW